MPTDSVSLPHTHSFNPSRWRIGFAAATALCLAAIPARAVPVAIDSGAIEGVTEGAAKVYKGIPFASPPVGELRWRAPQPPAPWSGVKVANRFSPVCMQRGAYPEDAPPEPMSEDCLYLNVWVPVGVSSGVNAGVNADASAGKKLPVMVWIHGGGLRNGSASTPLYSGAQLARHGVMVVTANYRLGALGFLAHSELTRESPNRVSGNYGLLDQLAALQWVQRNIAAFGGDAANVTVFGQSSGAISISALATSPLATGLFHRAIAQSGGLFEPIEFAAEFALKGAEESGAGFAARLAAPSLPTLRFLPAADIAAARFSPNAVIDGYLLREPPYNAYAAGRVNPIDILIGFNAGEGYDFINGRTVTVATLPTLLRQDFPPVIVTLNGPKTPATDQEALAAFVAFEGNMRFGWNMLAWADLHARHTSGNTFLYHFEHTPPGERGARHGVEMAYVFGHPNPGWTDADHRVANLMASYWANFAKTGNPNGEGLPAWPTFTPASEQALLIGDETRAGALPNRSDLAAIDRTYGAARFLMGNLFAVGGVALALLVALLVLAWHAVRRFVRLRAP